MTKEELKTIITSKENKLAERAIEIIENGHDNELAELSTLIKGGCSDIFYQRDPLHPRSRYRMHYVLDSCFSSSFGILKENNNSAILGFKNENINKSRFFRFLLENNFRSGSNNARGDLLQHIANCCFYPSKTNEEKDRQKIARELCKIMVELGKFDIQRYAENSYQWVANPESLEFLLEMGVNPKGHGLIDCALNYYACSPTSQEDPKGRTTVLEKLIALGAKPKEKLEQKIGHKEIKEKLKKNNLLKTIEETCIN
jgi:hypothetical protein